MTNTTNRVARRVAIFAQLVFCLFTTVVVRAETYQASSTPPPKLVREFRGVWVATVNNIDWPSQPGLPVAQQKSELLRIIERAAELHMNAIIFQVRAACDAFYPSTLEPWSEYLNGKVGQAPEPSWDPLAFAIEESHQRGIELHAWFNPFRARHKSAKSSASPNHVSRLHPGWTKQYGEELWLDPGEPAVEDYSIKVMLDVLKRYDVDGIHIDDYFYPYQVKNAGKVVEFPDEVSWSHYRQKGGRLERNEWRRENVDMFVQRLNREIHELKPWVKFGISPFGVWRPGFPSEVKRSLDAYGELYADARKWIQYGWADYFAPQLYWPISDPQLSFPTLLRWWGQQNPARRHLWPGLKSSQVLTNEAHWPVSEILHQVRLARGQNGVTGQILYSERSLRRENGTLGDTLAKQLFTEPVLVPESPWLAPKTVTKPQVTATLTTQFKVTFQEAGANVVRFWVVQTKTGVRWTTRIVSGNRTSLELAGVKPELVTVTAIDRAGNASAATVLTRNW